MTLEELQPDYDDPESQPKTLTKTRHIEGILHVAGRRPKGHEHYDIMCVTVAVEDEEASTHSVSKFNYRVPIPAEYLKGSTGVVKDVALQAGVDLDECYYTACCKWLLPRSQRARPSKKIMRWGLPILNDEIARVKPKIIVCLGKHVFDLLYHQSVKFSDAHGCWFWSEEYQAHLYVMYAPYTLVGKPELYETFRVDFLEVRRRKELLDSGADIRAPQFDYQVIRSTQELEDWIGHIEDLVEDGWPGQWTDEGEPLLAVDCEWHGRTHVDGQLRTIQFAWSESDAVVIEFRNERNEWSFAFDEDLYPEVYTVSTDPDISRDDRKMHQMLYDVVGRILARGLDHINARYIGHHFAADAPWMSHVLGLEVYRRCYLDTEFAQQTIDESSELGLERGIAMKYTNLGRYDNDLVMWKRDNRKLCEGGYGYIPASILIPYSAADVITPYRAYPMMRRLMEAQRLWEYYRNIFNPFVTDVFVEFCMTGLPMDKNTMDDLRELFSWGRDELSRRLQQRIFQEAKDSFKWWVLSDFGTAALLRTTDVKAPAVDTDDEVIQEEVSNTVVSTTLNDLIDQAHEEGVKKIVKKLLAENDMLEDVNKWNRRAHHLANAPDFNIRSPDQMATWLFDFEGLTPIKSTNQKAKGLPSMDWSKVMELPPDRRALYKPAVDKQTLEILSQDLPTIDQLLNLNAVGNLAKAFLKEPDISIDPVTGEEVIEENGLHAWLASDGRIHGQNSATETGRPRSWAPNSLNFPSYINKRVANTLGQLVNDATEEGWLPVHLEKWIGVPGDKIPSIRACVKAPDGWVMVESDYATAEMVALWKISGCEGLGRILGEPDPEWVYLREGNKYEAEKVRVGFADPSITGVPESARSDKFIMHVWENGNCLGPVSEDDLLRDEDGNPVHTKHDIHWSLIERTYGKFREVMNPKIDRSAAKVINFCCPGDSLVSTKSGGIVGDTRLDAVTKDQEVWDGEQWVTHAGVKPQGARAVVRHSGVTATPEHVVYTTDGPLPLFMAAAMGLEVIKSSPDNPSEELAAELGRERAWLADMVKAARKIGEAIEACPESSRAGLSSSYSGGAADYVGVVDVYDIIDAGPNNRFTCGGRVISNSSAYGASPASLERKIESDTGVKPPEGTGESGLEAIAERQPRATAFLEEMAQVPKTRGMYRAASGRIRHCITHSAGSGVGWRTRNSIDSALGREMRNYPFQESVGATSARACQWLLEAYRRLGLKARPMTCLYDSVVSLCPLEERFLVARLHKLCMSEINTWTYNDDAGERVLQFDIDIDFVWRWSTKTSKEEKTMLWDRSYHPASTALTWLEEHQDLAGLCGIP